MVLCAHLQDRRLTRDRSVILGWRAAPEWQLIRFVLASNDGLYPHNEEDWSTFLFRGRSVLRLRSELARRLGVVNLIMCVRAGRYGRLTPLVENLPRDGDGAIIEIVVIMNQTPGESLSLYISIPYSLLISFRQEIHAGSLIESVLHDEHMLLVLIFWNGVLICLWVKKTVD